MSKGNVFKKINPAIVGIIALVSVIVGFLIWVIVANREYPLVVFLGTYWLIIICYQPGKYLGMHLMKQGIKISLRDGIRSGGDPSSKAKKRQVWLFRLGIFVINLASVIVTGITLYFVESYLRAESIEVRPYILFHVLSFIATFLLLNLSIRTGKYYGQLAFYISIRNQAIHFLRLRVHSFVPENAYDRVGTVIYFLSYLSFIVLPLIIVFSEKLTLYILFGFSLIILVVPLAVIMTERMRLPDLVYFELPRFFIPLQIVLGFSLVLSVTVGYWALHFIRFNLLGPLQITIPFNVPRVFDDVFGLVPFSQPFIGFVETIAFATAISIVITWMIAVFSKRAWSELSIGVAAFITIVVIPVFLDIFGLVTDWLSDSASIVPAFLIVAFTPVIAGGLVDILRERIFPRKRFCINCGFDRVGFYDKFCADCGSSLNIDVEHSDLINRNRELL